MEQMIEQFEKISNQIVKAINDSELIIIVKNGKTSVIEHGKRIEHLKRVEFTDAIDEVPEIIIQKGVI